MTNLYTKNGITVDVALEALKKSDGGIVTNAPREMWEAEGWKPYEAPRYEQVEVEPTISEIRDQILGEIRNYYEDRKSRVLVNEELVTGEDYETLAEVENFIDGMTDLDTVEFMSKEISKPKLLEFKQALSRYKYLCYTVCKLHQKQVKGLKSKKELLVYGYTIGYPEVLKFIF